MARAESEKILDGAKVAAAIRAEVKNEVTGLVAAGLIPGLGVLLVGDEPASQIYVRNKSKACEEVGVHTETVKLAANASQRDVLAAIRAFNERPDIHAILVQLPLPNQVDSLAALAAVEPNKDVDGFHPQNVGLLALGRGGVAPCTPAGILEMLRREGIDLAGREALVIGRSDIVGKPMAALLLAEHCTVTIAHSRTRDLPAVARRADILVAALGKPGFVTADFVKEGAIVVDVGINRVTDAAMVARLLGSSPERMAAFGRTGAALVGDVDYFGVLPRAARITPVPGGVGPLTIAMLVKNTVRAARRQAGSPGAPTLPIARLGA